MSETRAYRNNLKTLSKIEQQLHMYTPDQLRNVLRNVIRIARESVNGLMMRQGRD